jgi:hypothetical protein
VLAISDMRKVVVSVCLRGGGSREPSRTVRRIDWPALTAVGAGPLAGLPDINPFPVIDEIVTAD